MEMQGLSDVIGWDPFARCYYINYCQGLLTASSKQVHLQQCYMDMVQNQSYVIYTYRYLIRYRGMV